MKKSSTAVGFFWSDPIPEKKGKRAIPEPTWLRPDYLPGLEEALRFDVPLFSDGELVDAAIAKHELVFDIECYENYFLVAFLSLVSNKVIYFELTPTHPIDIGKLKWVLSNFKITSFNGMDYDIPIVTIALSGANNLELKSATQALIEFGKRPHDVIREYKAKKIKVDHIDLIEVAPGFGSLKKYAGRMHAKKMQDLPFPPGTRLNSDQMAIVRFYCVNDLSNTALLRTTLNSQMDLRVAMGREYGVDLRSRSDAQMAESIIALEIEKLTRTKIKAPDIPPSTVYYYQPPAYLKFETPLLQWALSVICSAPLIVSEKGNIPLPDSIANLKLKIGSSEYRMGVGGLHSTEETRVTVADDEHVVIDRDVTSYYPFIILNQGLSPAHLGQNFLTVYRGLVDRRLRAKKSGDKVVADSLKITINGSFGKLGNAYSVLYAPNLLMQVTIGGQLSLLLLIELLELRGFTVVSANTDGIVIRCKKALRDNLNEIVKYWEKVTGFETEETEYKALYSRDVNNYIAVKLDGSVKTKGVYAPTGLQKNPTTYICVEAVCDFLAKSIPVEQTIHACADIRKFVTVRDVKGGAVKVWGDDGPKQGNEYLGKTIRWYYAKGVDGEIVYALSGNKVPKSDGAMPLMQLPDTIPADLDFDWYAHECYKMLEHLTGQKFLDNNEQLRDTECTEDETSEEEETQSD